LPTRRPRRAWPRSYCEIHSCPAAGPARPHPVRKRVERRCPASGFSASPRRKSNEPRRTFILCRFPTPADPALQAPFQTHCRLRVAHHVVFFFFETRTTRRPQEKLQRRPSPVYHTPAPAPVGDDTLPVFRPVTLPRAPQLAAAARPASVHSLHLARSAAAPTPSLSQNHATAPRHVPRPPPDRDRASPIFGDRLYPRPPGRRPGSRLPPSGDRPSSPSPVLPLASPHARRFHPVRG